MPTLIILLLVLTIATCVIAYWADNLGKKLGKKRISLWNLRPRQTATLITVASSVGIMLLTMSALLGANKSVRNSLTDYDRQKGESNRLKAQLPRLRADVERTQNEVNQAEARIKQAQSQTQQAQTQAQQAQTQTQKVQGSLKTAQGALKTAQTGETEAKRGQTAAQRGAEAARRQQEEAQRAQREAERLLGKARQTLTGAREQLTQRRQELAQRQQQLKTKQQELAQTQKNLRGKQKQVAQTQQSLKKTTITLLAQFKDVTEKEAQVAELEGKVARFNAQVTRLNTEVQHQQARVTQLNADIKTKSAQVEQFATETGLFFSQPISIEAGQVFTERTLPAGTDAATVQTAARALIEEGERIAKEDLGAVNGLQVVAPLVEVNGSLVRLESDQIVDNLKQYVSGSDVPVSIRLVAARNHRADEKRIEARFITIPVRPAFARDETIASMTIDGSQSEARVFNQLLALVEAGRRTAVSRDVSPPLTPKNRNFTVTGTNDLIFDASRRVRAANRSVTVRLVADAPLSTAEQLRVRFDVG